MGARMFRNGSGWMRGSLGRATGFTLGALFLTGCASVAELREVEREVWDLKRGGAGGTSVTVSESGPQLAELTLEVETLRDELAMLQGRLEVAEHHAQEALTEARAARVSGAAEGAAAASAAAGGPAAGAPDAGAGGGADSGSAAAAAAVAGTATAVAVVEVDEAQPAEVDLSQEVQDYRRAYAAWRENDPQECIDRFREFLQNHPSSAYADDAAYWIADCYFKQGDYKTAVLRFDDVVARNAEGKKAADALYRQGEALLRLGPRYSEAAGKAFERVLKEYPDSERAADAKRQLELLSAG